MKYIRRPVEQGQVVPLPRSAAYWSGRADQHLRRGNRRKAAALLRHAVSLSPENGDLRREYALLLQEMNCFEASTREAFAALTIDPERLFDCYGVIGHNLLLLGREQEALDAFSRYVKQARRIGADTAEWDDDLDQLETYYDQPDPDRRARYNTLVFVAARRVARGDAEGAKRALFSAERAHGRDERRYLVGAIAHQAAGAPEAALTSARRAVRARPQSPQALCVLAGLLVEAHRRGPAGSALLRAAALCREPRERAFVIGTAAELQYPAIALCALRAEQRDAPDRLPALYDQAVTLLRLGRLAEARACAWRCRELDPADVPAQCLSQRAERMAADALSAQAIASEARRLPYYPALCAEDRRARLQSLAEPLGQGLEAFCQRLTEDESLYETFLYMLGEPDLHMGPLLSIVADALPKEQAERMLRDVMVRPMREDETKFYAMRMLQKLGAPPPYLTWHAGRIAELDPRRARAAYTHALALIRRMSERERRALSDPCQGAAMREAAQRHYRALRGEPLGKASARVLLAQRRMDRLWPLSHEEENPHGDH